VELELPIIDFYRPDGVTTGTICRTSRLLPGSGCSTATDLFIAGTLPTTTCTGHRASFVCALTGLLPSSHCPAHYVIPGTPNVAIGPNGETITTCNIHISSPSVDLPGGLPDAFPDWWGGTAQQPGNNAGEGESNPDWWITPTPTPAPTPQVPWDDPNDPVDNPFELPPEVLPPADDPWEPPTVADPPPEISQEPPSVATPAEPPQPPQETAPAPPPPQEEFPIIPIVPAEPEPASLGDDDTPGWLGV
jgi:hypothetical protein